jgi:NADPH:quinone reductase-like Zn-dependent oxidoreductase
MKAIELQAYGQRLHLVERSVPEPGAKQVLVKIAAAPVNPSDLVTLDEPSLGGKLPMVPGREGSGTVVAAGSEAIAQRLIGKRVACASGYGRDGTWAEYLVTHAANCFALHEHINFEMGAMATVNPLTAWALLDIARRGGHQALANTAAASQLGRMIHRLGQSQDMAIVHIVRRPKQADLLKALGAQHILNSEAPDFPARINEMFKQVGVTLALDAVAGDMARHLLNALPDRGELVVYGLLSGTECRFDAVTMLQSRKRISGFLLSRWMQEQTDFASIADVVQQHLHAELKSEVHKRITLDEVPDAIAEYRENMTAGKVLLVL